MTGHHAILVHGTFGNGVWRSMRWNHLPPGGRTWTADWPLRGQLTQLGVVVHSFSWSGKNSHTARIAAGEELARYINEVKESGADEISIVAHSHGGTVAQYALGELARGTVRKAVFLATPFIEIAPHKLDWRVLHSLRMAVPVVMGLGAVMAVRLPLQMISTIFFIVLALIAAAQYTRAYRWLRRLVTRVHLAGRQYQPPPPPSDIDALILRKTGDEASAAIESVRFIEWILAVGWEGISRSMHAIRLSRILTWKLAGLGLILVGPSLILFHSNLPLLLVLPYVALVLIVTAAVALQISLLGLIYLLNLSRLGAGIPGAFLLRMSVEATPKGHWPVALVPASGFAHSEVHQDLSIAKAIAGWLTERAEIRPDLVKATSFVERLSARDMSDVGSAVSIGQPAATLGNVGSTYSISSNKLPLRLLIGVVVVLLIGGYCYRSANLSVNEITAAAKANDYERLQDFIDRDSVVSAFKAEWQPTFESEGLVPDELRSLVDAAADTLASPVGIATLLDSHASLAAAKSGIAGAVTSQAAYVGVNSYRLNIRFDDTTEPIPLVLTLRRHGLASWKLVHVEAPRDALAAVGPFTRLQLLVMARSSIWLGSEPLNSRLRQMLGDRFEDFRGRGMAIGRTLKVDDSGYLFDEWTSMLDHPSQGLTHTDSALSINKYTGQIQAVFKAGTNWQGWGFTHLEELRGPLLKWAKRQSLIPVADCADAVDAGLSADTCSRRR